MVSVLPFYSDDLSSNPADSYSFSVIFVFEKNENKQKRPGLAHFLKALSFMSSCLVHLNHDIVVAINFASYP